MTLPRARVLVAGIGNVFFGDDGFGPSVASRLALKGSGNPFEAADYGIRGLHLAYDLVEGGYSSLVLVDALPMNEPPGTLAVVKPNEQPELLGHLDGHSMSPVAVLGALGALGESVPCLVVGCQPGSLEPGMLLSAPVQAAIEGAVALVEEVAREEAGRLAAAEEWEAEPLASQRLRARHELQEQEP